MLQTEQLLNLAAFVEKNLGLKYPEERLLELKKQLMFSLKLDEKSFEEFVNTTLFDPNEKKKNLEMLAEALTVGETYFFRVGCGLEALKEEVLPALIQKKQGKQQDLRIWSTSCCRGDEPYSIAIILDELLGSQPNWNINLLGTDINKQFLHQAYEGLVSSWAFRNLSQEYIKKYFIQKDKNSFQLKEHIRRKVNFAYLNLVEDNYPSLENGTNAQDIILCNNTLYYFAQPTINKIIKKLVNSLLDGSYLIVSTVEASLINHPALIKTKTPNIFIKSAKVQAPVTFEKMKPPLKPLQPIAEKEALVVKTADDYYLEGDYHKCIEILSAKTLTQEEQILLIRAYANIGQTDQAEALCQQFLEKDSLQEELHLLLASILYEKNDYLAASLELKRTLFINPKNVMAHFLLCFILHGAQKKEESKVHQREALKILDGQADELKIVGSEQMHVGHMREILTNMDF